MNRRELGELIDYILRRMEQNTGIRLRQHGGIVVGITGGNGALVNGLQGTNGLTLRVSLTQFVIHNTAFVIRNQAVAE